MRSLNIGKREGKIVRVLSLGREGTTKPSEEGRKFCFSKMEGVERFLSVRGEAKQDRLQCTKEREKRKEMILGNESKKG